MQIYKHATLIASQMSFYVQRYFPFRWASMYNLSQEDCTALSQCWPSKAMFSLTRAAQLTQ